MGDAGPSGDWLGRLRGESVQAEARIMDEVEGEIADRALREKYGWSYVLFQTVIRLWEKSGDKPTRRASLELRRAANGYRPVE